MTIYLYRTVEIREVPALISRAVWVAEHVGIGVRAASTREQAVAKMQKAILERLAQEINEGKVIGESMLVSIEVKEKNA